MLDSRHLSGIWGLHLFYLLIAATGMIAAATRALALDPGDLVWAKHVVAEYEGTTYIGGDNMLNDLDATWDGGVVVCATMGGPTIFGPGEPAATRLMPYTISSIKQTAAFARYYSDGSLAWARQLYSPNQNYAKRIRSCPNGDIVVTGSASGITGFGTDDQRTTLTARGASFFVARYSPEGELAWARIGGSLQTPQAEANGLVVLGSGDVVISGNYQHDIILGEGEAHETHFQPGSAVQQQVFVARYAADGSLRWARSIGGPGFDWSSGLTRKGAGELRVNATLTTGTVVAKGTAAETTITQRGSYWVEMTTDGAFQRVVSPVLRDRFELPDGGRLDSSNFYAPLTLGKDAADQVTLTPYGSQNDYFAAYRADGTLRWAQQCGSPYHTYSRIIPLPGDRCALYAFSINGWFGRQKEYTFTGLEYLLGVMNPQGDFTWVRRLRSGDVIGMVQPPQVNGPDVGNHARLIVAGYYQKTMTLNADRPDAVELPEASEAQNFFIAKYVIDESSAADSQWLSGE